MSGSTSSNIPSSRAKDVAALRAGLQKLLVDVPPQQITKQDIATLHAALEKLKLDIAPAELSKNEMGETTKAALQKFQTEVGLDPNGQLTTATVDRLGLQLQHIFYTANKGRTQKLQGMLSQLGYTIDPSERKQRNFGPTTTQALKDFKEKVQLGVGDQITDTVVDKLREAALAQRLSTKTQVGQLQRSLLRASGIAKLDVKIDANELKQKELGATTQATISAFQQKYHLPVTGQIDPATMERIESVIASRPAQVKTLKVTTATNLAPVERVLRLNMANKYVSGAQQALAFLGYPIAETEFNANAFGKTTHAAVLAYQRKNGLPVTGHLAGATLKRLNQDIARANPTSVRTEFAYRIRGSVRDDLWRGKNGLKVQVWEKVIRGQETLLAERKTQPNGFFDVPYDPPRDPATKQIKIPFHLQIKVLDQTNAEIDSKVRFNPTLIAWVNFTQGEQPYRGTSEFDARMTRVTKVLGAVSIADIEESDAAQEITQLALNTGLSPDDVMRLALAHRAAGKLGDPTVTAQVFYAFIRQNLPATLPGDLLNSTVDWTLIGQLINQAVNGLVFMDAELQAQAFDNAAQENLISIAVVRQRNTILASLTALKQTFALKQPILVGNGSLQGLLEQSSLAPQHYATVASMFLTHKGLGPDFWADIKGHAADFGGDATVNDFEETVYVGHIAKNHGDTLSFLKTKIADPAETRIKSARDLAKLTHDDWVNLINQNGGKVPAGTDGATPQEQVQVYATTLGTQAERLYPTVAFTAAVKRSSDQGLNGLQHTDQIAALVDAQPDLDLGSTNLDAFIRDTGLTIAPEVLGEARVMQRVQRITPTAAVGSTLLEERIHHSAQIVAMGKDRFAGLLEGKSIDQRTALTVYSNAEFQYARALALLTDYRNEFHRADPQAIVKHTYTPDEQQTLLGSLPDLETLFGTLDFCDCPHCQSVYGPAAYLTDVLRFLESHPSQLAGKTVRDVLFDRRPDIGNIKLNCDNTETPLPYIDLVCEILEHAVPAPATSPDFSYQTTRTADELRAFPENVRKEAYDLLKTAEYPINSGFNLWQEEARVYLQHLGVSRADLMEAFQARPAGGAAAPADFSIAGEYWGISSHETDTITSAAPTTAAQTDVWGFDATQSELVVSTFLDHAKLSYEELLALLYVQWINPSTDPNPITIQRPVDTASLDKQKLTQLTPARLDRMHRFLRLWRHTSWTFWQLDLLIRAARVGNGSLDGDTLVHLRQFRQVQDKLGLDFETTLSFYHQINTEERPQPDMPQKQTPPLYMTLFQNPAVINPVDTAFALPLAAGEHLTTHIATLLAALAVTDADLSLLLARLPNDDLTVANLSTLLNYVSLARGLKLRVEDLLSLLDLAGFADPFSSPKQTLDLIETQQRVNSSGLQIKELDYLLQYRPDSPFGPRVEVITQNVEALRESLRSSGATTDNARQGQIASKVATTFVLTDEQAAILLQRLALGGSSLMSYLADPTLTARDANDQYTNAVSEATFPNIYNAYRLLHKVAMLVTRHKIRQGEDLTWLLAHHADIGALDFSALPVTAAPAAPLFPGWLALHRTLAFKARYPEPEDSSLTGVLALAADLTRPIDDVLAELSALTTWNIANLTALHTGLQLERGTAATPSDYLRAETYERLATCIDAIKRVGVDATTLLHWADRDSDTDDAQLTTAQEIKQVAKSKHDYHAWLSIAAPFEDALREQKRSALIAYLIEHALRTEPETVTVNGQPFANPRHWKTADDLLGYFLIDVEMGASQATSRIKQAMSSTQMFVQRCFLNLEQPNVEVSRAEKADMASLNSWKQWKWMKSYRIWEANRKVFLYPENWIDPALRDDKSPFFVELENELSQNELTADNAESAVTHYLEKVHDVARLEIVGVAHELDDDSPYDNLPPNINRLHIVGRTRTQPSVYYYRTFDLNYNTWTAWEKIDLDITGDHLIPVVYNRKLHLFWLVFTEKAQKVKKQPPAQAFDKPKDAPEPPKQLEIQLAWSVRRAVGWTAKQVSPQKLIHPWQRPLYSYHVKPRYKSRENQLWLDIYISTSQPFNNTLFYDPYQNTNTFVTATRFDETMRPWHSSSFVFDGHVVDTRMKALVGRYHILDSRGIASDTAVRTTSYQYVHDSFSSDGDGPELLSGPYQIAPRLPMPDGMHYDTNALANNKSRPNSSKLNVLESGASKTLLSGAKSPFELVFSQHAIQFDTTSWGTEPLIYQDDQRAFFIKPEWQDLIVGSSQTLQQLKYTFYPMYHPYSALFLRELGRTGLDGLLNRAIQVSPQSFYPGNSFNFTAEYHPTSSAVPDTTAQSDIVDFSFSGAYSIYNWEIFFHAPLLIATKLSQNQRFEEAMDWFHTIFDPTSIDAVAVPQRFWITRPFYEQNSDDYRKQRIEQLLENIGANLDQLRAWKNNPFKPHLIARYRPVAYQKAVVMKYLDNLIAWGDQLFRQDTIEAINEATTLYVLAYELLGRRPVKVPVIDHPDQSYNELMAAGGLDPFGNAKVEVLMENFAGSPVQVIRSDDGTEPLPSFDVSYFGIPDNDKLLHYWSTVEDRLFKIRHGMNIQGVVRQLPLFEPPIDPALLVKAAAAGVDLSSVLIDTPASLTSYRFRTLQQRALALADQVRALGDKLLSVLEQKDAEGLALLRSVNEVSLLGAVKEVRKAEINEAQQTWEGLEKGLDVLDERIDYYGSIPRMNEWETFAVIAHGSGIVSEIVATVLNTVAGTAHLIPQVKAGASGFGGSPHLTVEIGGDNVGKSSTNYAALFQGLAGILHQAGSMLETQGSYTRRDDENKFQQAVAQRERLQLEAQVEAAKIRYSIAEKALQNHELQIDQAQTVDEYLRSKYTNQQLFDWMLAQLATVHFQSYQLAFDLAKRAEQSFQFELGQPAASFIQFGYWDSLKKGLLAGERLANDLQRMETAYVDRNNRRLELTKHVSLAQFAPLDLVQLKETGSCTLRLPEWLFDLDYPGHYQRRLRSVAVTIPCVVGPYTSVNCTLALTNNGIRLKGDVAASYDDPLAAPDDRFWKSPVPVDMIATSHAQNDAGMFELNFSDERFLPFEGAGAVSEWSISLPKENNLFDFTTISDIILHVRYTAVPGSPALVNQARENVNATLPTSGARLLVLDREFGTEWYRFLHPVDGGEQILEFTIKPEHLPFYSRGKVIHLTQLDLLADSPEPGNFAVRLQLPGMAAPSDEVMTTDAAIGDMHHLRKGAFAAAQDVLGSWRIQVKKSAVADFTQLQPDELRNVYLVIQFNLS